jgi:chromosome segregation ATPase
MPTSEEIRSRLLDAHARYEAAERDRDRARAEIASLEGRLQRVKQALFQKGEEIRNLELNRSSIGQQIREQQRREMQDTGARAQASLDIRALEVERERQEAIERAPRPPLPRPS